MNEREFAYWLSGILESSNLINDSAYNYLPKKTVDSILLVAKDVKKDSSGGNFVSFVSGFLTAHKVSDMAVYTASIQSLLDETYSFLKGHEAVTIDGNFSNFSSWSNYTLVK